MPLIRRNRGQFLVGGRGMMLVGAGLAGTYMPGLQILNARLDDSARVRAVHAPHL